MGLIPAAGFARRIAGIPGSKEVIPLPPKGEPVIAFSLEAMARAGISDVVVVLRPEKEDIPRRLGSGDTWGLQLEYVETGPTRGPVETLDRAYERIRGASVALAFPDILMTCADPYEPLLRGLREDGMESVLGLFPRTPRQFADPVLLEEGFQGSPGRARGESWPPGQLRRVLEILPKGPVRGPGKNTPWCWGVAVWSPALSEFIHEEVERGDAPDWGGDWGLGHVLNRGVTAGLGTGAVVVSSDPFLDMGTPEGLAWALEGRRTPADAPP
ncbi:MAG: NTP transferase domain-containing protein [Gemmatimonadota bacterium]|nr:NTP transferase domain-containing protein [Gemmatimonadota bacterium]